jgi:hypothetical protein
VVDNTIEEDPPREEVDPEPFKNGGDDDNTDDHDSDYDPDDEPDTSMEDMFDEEGDGSVMGKCLKTLHEMRVETNSKGPQNKNGF